MPIVLPDLESPSLEYYGTPDGGDDYFENLFRRDLWFEADAISKRKALREATLAIERLSFKLCKADASQILSFPRGEDTEVPDSIVKATYELAYTLMNDVDPDAEIRNEKITSHTFSSVRTGQDTSFVQDHVHAGIPSSRAWAYLLPYLKPITSITFVRVS